MTGNQYLESVITKYAPHSEIYYQTALNNLKSILNDWAKNVSPEIIISGSTAKGSAISLCSDIDYLLSIASGANIEGDTSLEKIYNSLYNRLKSEYPDNIRKQNVSIRIELKSSLTNDLLEVDITPARRLDDRTNDHIIYIRKPEDWKWRKTNIQQHINDIKDSGRTKEIKLLKIWRENNKLDFPSVYLEYLAKDVLYYRSKSSDELANNFYHILTKLASDTSNPMFDIIKDPANSGNILSDLLTDAEKNKIIKTAKVSITKQYWKDIVS